MESDRDVTWLSGLLEGEGCFIFSKRRQLLVLLEMYDQDVVERAARIMGSRVTKTAYRERRGLQPSFRASSSGRKAKEIMEAILPQMGFRRSQKIISCISEWQRHCDEVAQAQRRQRNGRARFLAQTKEQRIVIAQKATAARWPGR